MTKHCAGTDAAKVIALGSDGVVLGVSIALAVGGDFAGDNMNFKPDHNAEDRMRGVVNILKSCSVEASMMARCTGKTRLHNLEPEDLRSVTIATAQASGIPMPGTSR